MIHKKILSLLVLLIAAVTASAKIDTGYQLTKTTGATEHGTVVFSYGEQTNVESAPGNTVVTITVTPTDADNWAVNAVTATVFMWTGGMQARQRSTATAATNPGITQPLTVSATDDPNVFTVTMPAAAMEPRGVEIDVKYGKIIKDSWIQPISSYTYNGSAKTPNPVVKDGNKTLVKGTDYTVTYSGNKNAGTATVTVTGIGDYAGTATANFTINRASSRVTFDPNEIEKTYGDEDFTVEPTTSRTGTLTYSSDNLTVATVDASTGLVHIVSVGQAKITATLARSTNYKSASNFYTLTVNPKAVTAAMIGTIASQDYDGSAKEPELTVKDGSTTLEQGTDYTVEYSNNTEPGTATVTITGQGNYTGTASKTFTIGPKSGSVYFYNSSVDATYGDSPFSVTLYTDGDGALTFQSSDTSVATVDGDGYVTVKKVGQTTITCTMAATATYTGDSDYYTLFVYPKSVTAYMIGDIAEQSYTGGPLTPAVTVTDGTATLAAGTDYTVGYSANIDPGTGTATITGKGNYTGTATKTFTIVNNTTPDTDTEASITISATGKSTFVSTRDVDFTNSTAQAYVAVGYDAVAKELTLSRVYKVPAGTPVMVKGDPGAYEVPFTNGVTTQYLDMLVGNTSSQTVEVGETDGELTNYVLQSGKFNPVASNAYVPTGKAYLQLPTVFPTAHKGSDQQVTLGASGKSTLCSYVDLDFTDVSGLKAYAAIGFDTQTNIVTLSRVLKASAGTPLVLHGTSNTTYTIPSIEAQTTYANMFVGNNSGAAIVVGETDENDPSLTNYYLTSGEFKAVVDNLTVPDGRCYLQLPTAASARALTRSMDAGGFRMVENDDILVIRLDGSETTKVEDLLKAAAGQDVYYNMGGVRTEKPGKGVYVKGQRKIAIK